MSSADVYRVTVPDEQDEDLSLRPESLNDFIGQRQVRENLEVFLSAARLRSEALDHILFSGPPGLGKTTLARIIAREQNASFHQVSAGNLKRPGDLVKLLNVLEKGDVLFIDEIHSLPAPVEEVLYPAMEDFQIDIAIGEGHAASVVNLALPRFTLVGATTRPGALSAPLTDRFGIKLRLEYYEESELAEVIVRAARLWKIGIVTEAVVEIAVRSRATPRIALRLLRRIWDFALVSHHESTGNTEAAQISPEVTGRAFQVMEIDAQGLTSLDISFLRAILSNYNGGPVGLKPLSAVLSEDIITLEDYIEPFLVRKGFVRRTPRGRTLTDAAYGHLGEKKEGDASGLFTELE